MDLTVVADNGSMVDFNPWMNGAVIPHLHSIGNKCMWVDFGVFSYFDIFPYVGKSASINAFSHFGVFAQVGGLFYAHFYFFNKIGIGLQKLSKTHVGISHPDQGCSKRFDSSKILRNNYGSTAGGI